MPQLLTPCGGWSLRGLTIARPNYRFSRWSSPLVGDLSGYMETLNSTGSAGDDEVRNPHE
jgi:hypothetical protein